MAIQNQKHFCMIFSPSTTVQKSLSMPFLIFIGKFFWSVFSVRSLTCSYFLFQYPPATSVVRDKSGGLIVGGYFAEIWHDLSERLNFTINYTLSIDGVTGSLNKDKKTWSGLVGMLIRGEIDVGVTELTLTKGRSHVVDPGIPMMTSE